jgi:hypothetical protein
MMPFPQQVNNFTWEQLDTSNPNELAEKETRIISMILKRRGRL